MKEWIIKSNMGKEAILSLVRKETYNYNFSNVFMNKAILAKEKEEKEVYLYFTGKILQVRSMYWIHISIEENEESYLKIRPELRQGIATAYYLIPAIIWFLFIGGISRNILLALLIIAMQLGLSTLVILIVKNIGKKQQIMEIFKFLSINKIISENQRSGG